MARLACICVRVCNISPLSSPCLTDLSHYTELEQNGFLCRKSAPLNLSVLDGDVRTRYVTCQRWWGNIRWELAFASCTTPPQQESMRCLNKKDTWFYRLNEDVLVVLGRISITIAVAYICTSICIQIWHVTHCLCCGYEWFLKLCGLMMKGVLFIFHVFKLSSFWGPQGHKRVLGVCNINKYGIILTTFTEFDNVNAKCHFRAVKISSFVVLV